MLFDYHKFLDELKEHQDKNKKEVFEKYSKYFSESINMPLNEQIWYKDYIEKFEFKDKELFAVPEAIKDDFDWDLLQKLTAGSFSSECQYFTSDGSKFEFEISVENNGSHIKKLVNELFGYQIERLFKIYVEEQMNLQIHIFENDIERNEIMNQRKNKLLNWSNTIHRDLLLFELGLSDTE